MLYRRTALCRAQPDHCLLIQTLALRHVLDGPPVDEEADDMALAVAFEQQFGFDNPALAATAVTCGRRTLDFQYLAPHAVHWRVVGAQLLVSHGGIDGAILGDNALVLEKCL